MENIVLSSELLELIEVHQIEVNDIIALSSIYEEVDIISIVENGCYYKYEGEGLDPELDAFINYCDDTGAFEEVPENLRYYIDYEKYYRDMKFNGMTVIEIDYSTYMYVFY